VEEVVGVVAERLHRDREEDLQDVALLVAGAEEGLDALTRSRRVLAFGSVALSSVFADRVISYSLVIGFSFV
jgi:hypothetical protein